MIAIPKFLRVVVAIALALMAFLAALGAVAVVYHRVFGTVGGNL